MVQHIVGILWCGGRMMMDNGVSRFVSLRCDVVKGEAMDPLNHILNPSFKMSQRKTFIYIDV